MGAFGTGPRTSLQQLTYRRRDRVLIVFGLLTLAASLAVTFLGYGQFWVPEFLLRLAGG